jgi:uncharacterized protein with GYD domain
MARFLLAASYTAEGAQGVASEGGTWGQRRGVLLRFGDNDVFIIADFPDNEAAASFSLAVNSTGALRGKVLAVLLTPEQVDQAAQKVGGYRPPGG